MKKSVAVSTLTVFGAILLSTTAFAADGSVKMSLGERITTSLQMVLIGMGLIFAVLSLLMCVLLLFKRYFYTLPQRKAAAKESAVKEEVPAPATTPDPTETNDPAVIAAITAAITAYFAAEGSTDPGTFRVVSFRKANGNSAWNAKRI